MSTFLDSAGWVGAMRCNYCNKWVDSAAGRQVEAVRASNAACFKKLRDER